MMKALVLTCGMVVPPDACTLETSLLAAPIAVEVWTCDREVLAGQTSVQVGRSGTYDKIECRDVPDASSGVPGSPSGSQDTEP